MTPKLYLSNTLHLTPTGVNMTPKTIRLCIFAYTHAILMNVLFIMFLGQEIHSNYSPKCVTFSLLLTSKHFTLSKLVLRYSIIIIKVT